jgi:hypothetical protein
MEIGEHMIPVSKEQIEDFLGSFTGTTNRLSSKDEEESDGAEAAADETEPESKAG